MTSKKHGMSLGSKIAIGVGASAILAAMITLVSTNRNRIKYDDLNMRAEHLNSDDKIMLKNVSYENLDMRARRLIQFIRKYPNQDDKIYEDVSYKAAEKTIDQLITRLEASHILEENDRDRIYLRYVEYDKMLSNYESLILGKKSFGKKRTRRSLKKFRRSLKNHKRGKYNK